MVVTKKTPSVPAPPVSRTTSSQPTPRAAKGKAQTTSNVQGVLATDSLPGASSGSENSRSRSNNLSDTNSSPQKHKSKSKSKKKKSRRLTTFWDFLIRLLCICFIIYTIQVCPNDTNHQSSVCYGLSKCRELIIDRYVFPAFHRVLAHPYVAPHVERVKPPFNTAIRIGKPIVRRTKKEWNGRVVPQWNKRVVPQWHNLVVPQWNKHVVPQLALVDQKIEPYRTRVSVEYNRYSSRIVPHVKLAIYNLQRWQRQTQPYIILAATKTHDSYQTVKPYAIPVWNHIKAGLKQLLLFAREQRVLFVDPHVATIWEKVKELSSGRPKGDRTLKQPAAPGPTAPVTRKKIPIEDEVAPPVTEWAEAPPLAENLVSSASYVRSQGFEFISPSSTVTTSPSEEVTPIPDITGPPVVITGSTPLEAEAEDYLDLDEFARELDLDESESVQAAETVVPPPVKTESEEEKVERLRKQLEETAKKRADIMNRCSNWEADLKELVKAKKKSLRTALVLMRKAAVAELRESKKIRGAIEELTAEAEKYLKGARAYLKTIKKEGKTDAVRLGLWDKVVDKVARKFNDRLKDTEGVLKIWHMHFHDQETQEVERAVAEVTRLGEQAQADLGLDLAWLDDVTYADWQRYHDLIRVGENFTELATSIQNGTHSSPPINPVASVLVEIEVEVKEVAKDFETRLQQLQHDGVLALSHHIDEDKTASTPQVSVLPIPESHDGTGDIPPIIVGRSKEEVVDALDRTGKEGAGAVPSEDAAGEEMLENLARDASLETGTEQSSVPPHVEL